MYWKKFLENFRSMRGIDILGAIFVAAVWGTNFAAAKACYASFTPFFLLVIRFFLSCFPLVFFVPKPTNPWKEIVAFGLTFWFVQLSFIYLAIYIGFSGGLAGLILQSQVILIPLISFFLFGTRLSLHNIFALSISLCGMVAIGVQVGGEGDLTGFCLMLLAAISSSIGTILLKRYHFSNMFGLIVWSSLVPILPLLGMALFFEGPEAFVQGLFMMDATCIGAIGFMVYLSTLVAPTLQGLLVKRYQPAAISPFLLLVPVFSMLSCAIFLGETFTTGNLIASGVVILGLVINQFARPLKIVPPKPAGQPEEPTQKAA